MNVKKVCAVLLALMMSCLVFADEIEDLKKALSASNGYYYNPDSLEIMYREYDEETGRFRYEQYYPDFSRQELHRILSGTRIISADKKNALKELKRYTIEDGIITVCLEYDSNPFYRLDYTTSEQILEFLKSESYALFDRMQGTYTDSHTGRTYTLTRSGDTYLMKVEYPAGENQQTVQIAFCPLTGTDLGRCNLPGEPSGPYWVSTDGRTLRFGDAVADPNAPVLENDEYDYCCGDDEEMGYTAVFEVQKNAATKKTEKIQREVEPLHASYYYGNGDQYILHVNKESVMLSRCGDGSDGEPVCYADEYRIFMDEYGYEHLQFDTYNYILIDGKDQYFVFAYTGDSLSKDAQAVANQFVAKEKLVTGRFLYAAYTEDNGGHFSSATATSTLRDKYHTYDLNGALVTFNPVQSWYPRCWVKNNIPWVEGKADDGIGEKIELDVIPETWSACEAINLRILSGYVDPLKPYLFKENGRLKTLLVETDGGVRVEMQFNDKVEFTSVELPIETKHITLTITDVYPGSKYHDTCISAIDMYYRLWDK